MEAVLEKNQTVAEILEIEIFAAGSTTFQREDLERGFEPDECYYIQNAPLMGGKDSVNLNFDPPPDLTIEVDVKHSSLNRMGILPQSAFLNSGVRMAKNW